MADVTVHLRYARITPRKARAVIDLVRGKSVAWSQAHLPLMPLKAARMIGKLLKSGVAAAQGKKMTAESLTIKVARVQEGPRLKRGRSHFRGTIRPIDKQMSHVTLILSDETATEAPKKKQPHRVLAKQGVKNGQ